MKKMSTKKRVVTQKKRGRLRFNKASTMEDSGVSCPDCREPMTQVLTATTFKWECRCAPGIHYCCE